MKENVMVYIHGLQRDMDDEPIEIYCPGTYYLKNDTHYVFYEEQPEGLEEVTKCQLRLHNSKRLEIIKKGALNTTMIFEPGKKTETKYMTPLGMFVLEICTENLSAQKTDEGIQISANYSIGMDGNHLTHSEIKIQIKTVPQ